MGKRGEQDVTVHCFDCKAPWILSRRVLDEAMSLLAGEFPEGAMIAFQVPSGYLCENCQKKREESAASRPPTARRPRKRAH